MSRDEAYTMLRLGRHIERGDMVTRVLDVRAGLLLGERPERAELYDDLQWSSVLRSLSALQMYNRRSAAVGAERRGDQVHSRRGDAFRDRSRIASPACSRAPGSCRSANRCSLRARGRAARAVVVGSRRCCSTPTSCTRKADRLQIAIGTISDRIAGAYFGHTAWPS